VEIMPVLDILERTVLLAAIRVVTHCGQTATVEARLKRDIRGFKSRQPDRSAATVAVIELLLKGFAGARNHHYLQLWRLAA
jgi:hypothetical protein